MRKCRDKSKFCFLLSIIVAISMPVFANGKDGIKSDDIVALCGDSITENKSYTAFIETYFAVCHEEGPIHTAQFGWGGDCMRALWGRGGPRPILSVKPTVVTTLYGMNDGYYAPLTEATASEYRNGLTRLVGEFASNGVRMVIVSSPGAVDTKWFRNDANKATMYNQTLAGLRDVAKQVADENGCVFANAHDLMIDVMAKAKKKYGDKYPVAGTDGVHPHANGGLIIAYVFLRAMGCNGNIGAITHDLKRGISTASAGHKILSSKAGEVTVESSRYPFCFSGKPDDPAATSGIIEFFPFNEDLNRLTLKVTGAPGQSDTRVRVYWGNTNKVFSSAALEKGVNLADEYHDNPFRERFAHIQAEVLKKQTWERLFYHSYLSGLPALQKEILEVNAELADKLNRLTPALVKRQARCASSLATNIVPVIHTIRLEIDK